MVLPIFFSDTARPKLLAPMNSFRYGETFDMQLDVLWTILTFDLDSDPEVKS